MTTMRNRAGDNEDDALVTHEGKCKNYEVSERKNKTIRAPGSVRRLTVSVVLDGNLDNATKMLYKIQVQSAVRLQTNKEGETL